jgi:hypothetical protein
LEDIFLWGPQRNYRAIQAASFDEISLNGCAPIPDGRSANAAVKVVRIRRTSQNPPIVCGSSDGRGLFPD